MEYRKEIDGLRALAVLPVLLCHTGIEAFSGGYLGVDVFFVISGYLITAIISGDLKRGRFSLMGFYEKRTRRIMPALFFVMLIPSVAALFLLIPDDLENFGQSVVATTLFSNNVLIYLTSGYWALEADFKPLVHTWSLAVEEQYYIVAPLMLMLLARYRATVTLWVFGLLVVVSLIWSQASIGMDRGFGFLMIFTRAWEIGAGALIAIVMQKKWLKNVGGWSQALSLLGLILLMASYCLFSPETRHPGLVTLWPVLATSLIIMFSAPGGIVTRVLSNRILVYIGLISYSAYLWHQPIFAYMRISSLEEPSEMLMVSLIGLVFILAFFSWKYVEAPFRDRSRVSTKKLYAIVLPISVMFCAFGLYLHVTSGRAQACPEMYVEGASGSGQHAKYNESAFKYRKSEFVSEKGVRKVLVLGDSFARDFLNSGYESANFNQCEVVYDGIMKITNNVSLSDSATTKNLMRACDVLVIALNFKEGQVDALASRIENAQKEYGCKVVVIGTKNFGWNNNAVMLLPENRRYKYRAKVLQESIVANDKAKNRFGEEIYLDMIGMLADSDNRVRVFTENEKFISHDRAHLTKFGAEYVGGIIFQHPLLSLLR